jgi:TolB-like protein
MSLIAELKRRNVFRVGVAYVICAWVIAQVADLVLENIEAPDWVMQAIMLVLAIGFPLALIFAWAFELTPEGIKRESDVDPGGSVTKRTGRKLDFLIIAVLAVGIIYFAVDKFVLQPAPEPTEVIAEAVPAAEPTTQVKTIAVLPFANMSGDPEQEFFSDGISEELLNVLAKVKGLRVTSRTSAFAFKGKDITTPEIAEKLGVKHVLEGSVRMAGDRVRITTQLIEVETDSHLWSESYDRELADIFAVQDEIAAKVGEALKIALLGADARPIRPSHETSIEAYSDYLLARQKLANMTYVNAEESERLLKSVIERDPEYAPAYAALAGTYRTMAGWGMFPPSEASARMMPLVDQALMLDDRLAEAWQHLAYIRWASDDLEGAHSAEERALELDPPNPLVLRSQIARWTWTHESERALAYANQLLRVDPLSPWSLRLIANLYARLDRFDDMERMIEHMRSIESQNVIHLWSASYLANSRGDLVTALRLVEEATRIDIGDPEGPSSIALTYFDLGDVTAAEFWNDAALRRDPAAPVARMVAALLHLYHKREAEAVAIARELTRPGSHRRWATRGIALRMVAAADVAAGNYEEIITRYLTHYPELADGKFPTGRFSIPSFSVWESFIVTLDLASVYLHGGQEAKAESLLSLVESELPHWSRTSAWGYGIADVELHALRGYKEEALAALQEHAAKGLGFMSRWQLLYNPNLESIRDTPEFSAIVAEIEADMAEQLARVREMQRSGELTAIPELAAE